MHKRSLSIFVSVGILLAFLMAAALHQSAQAKTCYNGQNMVVPCPNYQNPTQPEPPTATPVPTDTPVPADAANPPACVPVTGPGDSGQAPTQGNSSPFFSPGILLGGGGLLGILIGLLIGTYVVGPMMNRGGAAPGELLPAVDMFAKDVGGQRGVFKKHKEGGDVNGGIVTPSDNPAGIIAVNKGGVISPSDSHGFSNVNGDDNFAKFHNEADVNGDSPTQAGPGGGPHTAEPPAAP